MASSANLQQAVTASLEALTKAAISESQEISIELARESLAEQKRGAAASQATLSALISKVDTLSSKLDTLLSNTVALSHSKQDSLIILARTQTLQWAIQSITDGKVLVSENFDYNFPPQYDQTSEYDCRPSQKKSSTLVIEILTYFLRSQGMWISNDYYVASNDEAGREALRAKLSNQIHTLTGSKPRLAKEMNGKVEQWAIYRV